MNLNNSSFLKLLSNLDDEILQTKVFICEARFNTCQFCSNLLSTKSRDIIDCVVFTLYGPKQGVMRQKYCPSCQITYNADNYQIKRTKNSYFINIDSNAFIVTSCKTVFEISLLEYFDKHLVRNAISFSGNLIFNKLSYYFRALNFRFL